MSLIGTLIEQTVYIPGLVKREIVAETADTVTVREVWDLTVPNCPMICLNKEAISYERTVTIPYSGKR